MSSRNTKTLDLGHNHIYRPFHPLWDLNYSIIESASVTEAGRVADLLAENGYDAQRYATRSGKTPEHYKYTPTRCIVIYNPGDFESAHSTQLNITEEYKQDTINTWLKVITKMDLRLHRDVHKTSASAANKLLGKNFMEYSDDKFTARSFLNVFFDSYEAAEKFRTELNDRGYVAWVKPFRDKGKVEITNFIDGTANPLLALSKGALKEKLEGEFPGLLDKESGKIFHRRAVSLLGKDELKTAYHQRNNQRDPPGHGYRAIENFLDEAFEKMGHSTAMAR